MFARPKIPKGGGRNVNLETHFSKYSTREEVFLPTYPTYPIYPTYRHGCASCAISAFGWWSSSSYALGAKDHHSVSSPGYQLWIHWTTKNGHDRKIGDRVVVFTLSCISSGNGI